MRVTHYCSGWHGGDPNWRPPSYVDRFRMRWFARYRKHTMSGSRFERRGLSAVGFRLHWRIRLAKPVRRKQVRFTPGLISEGAGRMELWHRINAMRRRKLPQSPAGYKSLPRLYRRSDVPKLVRQRLFNMAQPMSGWDRAERRLAGRRSTCAKREGN